MQVDVIRATRMPGTASSGVVTLRVVCPEWVHTHLRTHGRIAHNWISHRAVRTERFEQYYTPTTFLKARSGMQGAGPAERDVQLRAAGIWHAAMQATYAAARDLELLGISKQQRNRLIAPPHLMQGVLTATEDGWHEMLRLRLADDADPATQEVAVAISHALEGIRWSESYAHIPFIKDELQEVSLDERMLISASRIARISYGSNEPSQDELARAVRLWNAGHASPFDQVAWQVPLEGCRLSRLFCEVGDVIPGGFGWLTYRAWKKASDLLDYLRREGL